MTVPTVTVGSVSTGDPVVGDFTVTLPSHVIGDLLVVVGGWSESGLSADPSGWTRAYLTGAPPTLLVHWRVATSTSTTAPTFVESPASFHKYCWLTFKVAAGTFDATTPLDAFAAAGGGFGPPTAPSITPSATRDHEWVVAMVDGGDGTTGGYTIGYPSGFTGMGRHSQNFNSFAVARQDYTASGNTPTAAFTYTVNNGWTAIGFFIRPPAAGGGSSIVAIARHRRRAA